jgi:transposase
MKNKRMNYTIEFKREAVDLVGRQGHTYASAGRLLKINPNLISRWAKELAETGHEAFPGSGHQRPELEEIARLKREVRRLTEENEIIKKAAAYFARATL